MNNPNQVATESTAEFDGGFYNPEMPTSVTRYHVPHWHQDGVYAFVTWRLADSMPIGFLELIKAERRGWLKSHPLPWGREVGREYSRLFTRRVEAQLDAGIGRCILRDHEISSVAAEALRFFDGARYDLDSFVVMPNHVHVLVRLREQAPLPKLVHSWKSYSAKVIRRPLKCEPGIWQRGYWDTLMRSERQLANCRRYIAANLRKAGLRADEFRCYSRAVSAARDEDSPPSGTSRETRDRL